MEYVQEITLDLNADSVPVLVSAKQDDELTRKLKIYLMSDGEEYQPEPDAMVLVRIKRPDGTYLADAAIASIDNNIVEVTLTSSALRAAGRALVDIVLYNGSQYLSTASFILKIQPSPSEIMNMAVPTDGNDYPVFLTLMSALGSIEPVVSAAVAEAVAASNSAKYQADNFSLTTGSAMDPGKDPTITGTAPSYIVRLPSIKPMAKISIDESGSAAAATVSVEDYTGDPIEGYNSNLIKVFNFGITLPSGRNVQIDNTLTQQGQAADAAAVGSALASKYDASTGLGPSNVGISSSSPLALENGGTGASDAASARANLGAQTLIQVYTSALASGSAWDSNNTQSLTITGMTSNSEFIASPNTSDGWAAAADAMLFPPTAGSGILTFTCETIPTVNIPITVYWW